MFIRSIVKVTVQTVIWKSSPFSQLLYSASGSIISFPLFNLKHIYASNLLQHIITQIECIRHRNLHWKWCPQPHCVPGKGLRRQLKFPTKHQSAFKTGVKVFFFFLSHLYWEITEKYNLYVFKCTTWSFNIHTTVGWLPGSR